MGDSTQQQYLIWSSEKGGSKDGDSARLQLIVADTAVSSPYALTHRPIEKPEAFNSYAPPCQLRRMWQKSKTWIVSELGSMPFSPKLCVFY